MDPAAALASLGGVASLRALSAEGITPLEMQRARRAGLVLRLRRGWYAIGTADPDVIAAVRCGGALDCLSVLEKASVWIPRTSARHVAIPRSAHRAPPDCVVHWTIAGHAPEPSVLPLPVAIAHAMRCASGEEYVAIIESALHKGLTTKTALRLAGVPASVLAVCDAMSESGGESLVRCRLRARRIGFRQQVRIDGVGRVDFLVGDRFVIEVDGYAHHGDRDAFELDRKRDAMLIERGFIVLRVSVLQVETDWARIDRVLSAVVRSGRHRWPRRR